MKALIAALIAGLATGIGALPLLFVSKISKAMEDLLLGFAAGIMIFASSFSLIRPVLMRKNILQVILGLLIGAIIMAIVEITVPHIHLDKLKVIDFQDETMKKTILLLMAIIIHSIPEGLAIGVGYSLGDSSVGLVMTISIAVQNLPEGLVVSAPLIDKGYSRLKAIAFGFLAGMGQPLGAALGVMMGRMIIIYKPFIFSLAAGAMYYVVSHELIPESHCNGNQMKASFGVIFGFIIMLFIDYMVK
ncbi:ZIP family metal transporter [Paramaledivibacter caminithermalis]|uniref:Zinc transporter, ZIP family n=1 Tax=Paramaledivibacter caminithermalis (strain DSM 15212 / CIP 107654 / DViRD3) TaxID=1121301 RepID=A0A1M6MMG7_PARC5|nr:ZIP family metal transporter [Paramaledivibacter caminithermalis]SHJ84678.1 zinc transporter, ZIP family [Paramaledivibacter caminithermalis DSM 15212]